MPELVSAAMPFFPVVLLTALLLCLAPQLARKGRITIAVLFLFVPLGFGIDLLLFDHSGVHTLEVPNFFPRGPDAEPHRWVTETVVEPAWKWHVCVMIAYAIPGLLLLLRAGRAPAVPNPLLMPVLVFWFFLATRLGLEKTAAPEEIVWAVGATPSLLVTLPFLGWWCGRRGMKFGRFVGMLLGCALLQRLPIVVWGWFATTKQLGTHLDTHVVTDISLPGIGPRQLVDAYDAWLWPTAIPHLTLWIVVTLVAGIVLGSGPRWFAARRK